MRRRASASHLVFQSWNGLESQSGFSVFLHVGSVYYGFSLLSELRNSDIFLLPGGGQNALVGNVGLREVRLALLVLLDLKGGFKSKLLKPVLHVPDVTGQNKQPVLLGVCTVSAPNTDFLIDIINTRLEHLNLPGLE